MAKISGKLAEKMDPVLRFRKSIKYLSKSA